MEKQNSKKRRRYSKCIVALIIILNVIFTGVVFYSFIVTGGAEPTTLIVSWFAFTGTELVALAGIKCTEIKQSKQDELTEDPYNETDEDGEQ